MAQLKLLQEDVTRWMARRQSEPVLLLRFDNVTKRVGVPAVGRHLPQTSFQAALELPSYHDDFIEVIGLRSPDGEEIFFEEGDGGELMLFDWEQAIIEDNIYTVLYEDSREDAGELLTEEERGRIVAAFDAIDVKNAGVVSLEDIEAYADSLMVKELIAQDSVLEELRAKGASGAKAAAEQERLLRQRAAKEKELLLQTDVDGDGTVELHEYFRVRAQHYLAKRGVQVKTRAPKSFKVIARNDDDADNNSDEEFEEHCDCGKKLLPNSLFCTHCGAKRQGPVSAAHIGGKPKKKKVVRKKKTAPSIN